MEIYSPRLGIFVSSGFHSWFIKILNMTDYYSFSNFFLIYFQLIFSQVTI